MNKIEDLRALIIYLSQNNGNESVEGLYNEKTFWGWHKSQYQNYYIEKII